MPKSKNKLIARGGINKENISICKEIGFFGVALASSIWNSDDPIQEFCKVKDKFKELNLSIE